MLTPGFLTERHGTYRVFRHRDVDAQTLLEAVGSRGDIIKASKKSSTERVGDWVVKRSLRQGLKGIAKRSLQRKRYRQGWAASIFLRNKGILVPRPYGFVEHVFGGLILGNALVSEYLEGQRNVEQYAEAIVGAPAVSAYLEGIARAVNDLTDTGSYHADLSGKNIFTGDGQAFHFIDLDGVELNCRYTEKRRLKNHVQLYDSFCDRWGDEFLGPFVQAMLPKDKDPATWLTTVKDGQAVRRARIEAKRRNKDRVEV